MGIYCEDCGAEYLSYKFVQRNYIGKRALRKLVDEWRYSAALFGEGIDKPGGISDCAEELERILNDDK